MATALTDLVLDVGSLTGLGQSDFNSSSTTPLDRPGTIKFLVDAFGYKVIRYVKNKSGSAVAIGELLAKPADVSVSTISAGSTTTSVVTTGLTASAHNGKIFYVLDNADSAGAAPEGETAIVASNTAALITLDAARPLGTSLAASDTGVLISTWQAEDAADGDTNDLVLGVVMGTDGFADEAYGWVQMEGVCPRANITTDAQTLRDTLVAAAAALGPDGSDESQLWCGFCLGTVTSDQVALIAPAQMTLFSMVCGLGTA